LTTYNKDFDDDDEYATGVSPTLGPPKSSTLTASRSLQPFLQGSLGDRPTDRPTDHASLSVTIGRAHNGEAKFCYCVMSMATTSTYWSSRLNKSDQLQQSAAIFSCTTRRIAVYLETHCDIGLKRAFPTAYSTGDTTVHLFTDEQAV